MVKISSLELPQDEGMNGILDADPEVLRPMLPSDNNLDTCCIKDGADAVSLQLGVLEDRGASPLSIMYAATCIFSRADLRFLFG